MASASPRKKVSLEGLVQSTLGLTDPSSTKSVTVIPSSNAGRSVSQPIMEQSHNRGRPGSLAVDSGTTSPIQGDRSPSQVVKALKQISRESRSDSLLSPESESPAAVPLLPRQPTGSEWSSSARPHTRNDVVSMTEVLKQLDQQAESRKRHTLQIETRLQLEQPISWEEESLPNSHFWYERETREACYLNDSQFCQDQKSTTGHSRKKVRCSACKVLVHVCCIRQLYYQGIYCKPTFREIKQKVKDTTVVHHFLQRRKMRGKCAGCGKGFGNWKTFTGRTFEGISCSWCEDAYHLGCWSEQLRDESCHFGILRNIIIPPSWIVKLPRLEQDPDSSEGSTHSKNSSRRKKTTNRRRTKRHSSAAEDNPSKNFTVKPLVASNKKPIIVFINPKSGGNQGTKLMQMFFSLLNPRQVFDLSLGGPMFGLKMFKGCSNLRVLACGGDGTVGWVLSILDQLDWRPFPPVAVLPLGTGNDLARVLGWGGAYGDEPLDNVLKHVEDGSVVEMDRWMCSVWPNPEVENWADQDGKDDVPIHVINNYFSVGADAQVSLEFHESREANPQKFNKRFINKYFYTKLAGQDLVLRKFSNLTDHIKIVGDGIDLTAIVRQLRLEAICLLNINSYGAGCNAWGTPPAGSSIPVQAIDDGMIEVVGFWASTFPKMLMGAHGERIGQYQHIKIHTYTPLPVQIDGEACKLKPSVIEVVHQNKALMIKKSPLQAVQSPFSGVGSHALKLAVCKVSLQQYQKYHSDLKEIRTIGVPMGLVVTTGTDTLKTLRPQIERFVGKGLLDKNWQFLDVASTGRMDRVFQIVPEQEDSISVRDMLSDGILVVELSSPVTSPLQEQEESSLDVRTGSDASMYCRVAMDRNLSYSAAVGSESLGIQMSNKTAPPDTEIVIQELDSSPSNTLTVMPQIENTSTTGSLSSTPSKSPEPSLDELDMEGDTSNNRFRNSPLPLPIDIESDEDMESRASTCSLSEIQKAVFDAVKRGNLQKLKTVHEQGGKLAYVDSYGLTPLHHAARLGRKDIVKYLVDNMPRDALDLQDEEKAQTALHKAAWYGYRGICKILVDAGASLSRTDYQGNTPYHKSIESDDLRLQEYLQRKVAERKTSFDANEAAI